MSALPKLVIGNVMHRRLRPARNDFVYPVFYMQMPVNNLGSGNCAVFSVDRNNLLSFHQKDHGPKDGSPLLPWIQAMLREHHLREQPRCGQCETGVPHVEIPRYTGQSLGGR
mgnify:CR=1 FL=1